MNEITSLDCSCGFTKILTAKSEKRNRQESERNQTLTYSLQGYKNPRKHAMHEVQHDQWKVSLVSRGRAALPWGRGAKEVIK